MMLQRAATLRIHMVGDARAVEVNYSRSGKDNQLRHGRVKLQLSRHAVR